MKSLLGITSLLFTFAYPAQAKHPQSQLINRSEEIVSSQRVQILKEERPSFRIKPSCQRNLDRPWVTRRKTLENNKLGCKGLIEAFVFSISRPKLDEPEKKSLHTTQL